MSNKDKIENMGRVYKYYETNFPEVENPHLGDKDGAQELLIACNCSKRYRVWVNEDGPVGDYGLEGIKCPNCGKPAKGNYSSIARHSAGVFNAIHLQFD